MVSRKTKKTKSRSKTKKQRGGFLGLGKMRKWAFSELTNEQVITLLDKDYPDVNSIINELYIDLLTLYNERLEHNARSKLWLPYDGPLTTDQEKLLEDQLVKDRKFIDNFTMDTKGIFQKLVALRNELRGMFGFTMTDKVNRLFYDRFDYDLSEQMKEIRSFIQRKVRS